MPETSVSKNCLVTKDCYLIKCSTKTTVLLHYLFLNWDKYIVQLSHMPLWEHLYMFGKYYILDYSLHSSSLQLQ